MPLSNQVDLHEAPLLPYLENTPFTADHCLKCNVCTQACPVAAVTPLFPGPKTVGPQAQRFRDPEEASPDHSVDYCSSCGICTLVCPHGVKVMEINTQAKAKLVESEPLTVNNARTRLRNWILARNALWGILGTPIAPILNFVFGLKAFRIFSEITLGMARQAPFPKWAGYTFREWFRRHERTTKAAQAKPVQTVAANPPSVVYYHGCSTNAYEPRIGKLAVRVLEKNGFNVIVPPQACCGLPFQSNGDFVGARKLAHQNVDSLLEYAKQGIPIVGTSGSCIMALKSDYHHILGMDDENTHTVAANIYDISEFLVMLHGEGKLNTDFVDELSEYRVPYHAPCQLKAHGMGRPALDVLDLIPGLRMVEMDAECCGIAGTYGYKAEKRQIAELVGEPLFKRLRASDAPLGVCDTETCRWHIAQMSGKRMVHPVELVARAYGITAEK
jgi:glycerol-3-phosphate dehydrogenase subunit C